ncbi:MAG: hypothetical protein CL927_10135 [Deltaproteobacteria bacterium]|nr:hypothetical protein [Deltaproteobacteria bacterium]HCH62994.1 hypothetical protein [Deltaproteobacteria bacterium]
MSERNTGIFVLGHLSDDEIRAAFAAWPEYDPAHFADDETPRVGRSERSGQPYTHIALRLFEVAGFRLMDENALPGARDLEMVLGQALSERFPVVYALYEDETMAGGGARFESGSLVYRVCIDGRVARPVRRALSDTQVIPSLDPSDWIWPHASTALQQAFGAQFSAAPTTDDDLEVMILAARAEPLSLPAAATPLPSSTEPSGSPTQPPSRRRDRVKARLRSLLDW